MRRLLLAFAFTLTAAAAADAATITYFHTGFGSGTLDGVAFGALAPVEFTITATGDTDDVTSCGGACIFNDNLTASISIDGVGTFDFVTGTRYFFNSGIVGFSRAGAGGLDLFNGPNVGAWDLASSIGPIVGTGLLLQWTSSDVVTTGGVLVFNSGATAATFQAVVNGEIPEPATMLLVGGGLLAGAVRRRMKTRP
jgi:hypothetical protein